MYFAQLLYEIQPSQNCGRGLLLCQKIKAQKLMLAYIKADASGLINIPDALLQKANVRHQCWEKQLHDAGKQSLVTRNWQKQLIGFSFQTTFLYFSTSVWNRQKLSFVLENPNDYWARKNPGHSKPTGGRGCCWIIWAGWCFYWKKTKPKYNLPQFCRRVNKSMRFMIESIAWLNWWKNAPLFKQQQPNIYPSEPPPISGSFIALCYAFEKQTKADHHWEGPVFFFPLNCCYRRQHTASWCLNFGQAVRNFLPLRAVTFVKARAMRKASLSGVFAFAPVYDERQIHRIRRRPSEPAFCHLPISGLSMTPETSIHCRNRNTK